MAIVPMQKVAVLAHRSHKEQVLQVLQELGVLEVSEARSPGNVDHTEVNFRAAEVQFAFDTLAPFASKETIATTSKPANANDVLIAANTTDVRGIVERLHALEEIDTEAERQIAELTAKKEAVAPWLNLTRPLDAESETNRTVTIFGTLPESKYEECVEALQEIPRTALERISTLNGITYVTAAIWKTDRARFEEIVTGLGWTSITLPRLPGLAAVSFEEAAVEEKRLRRQKELNREERVRLSVELPNLRKMQLFLLWLDDKQAAREAMLETFATVTLLGWMPRESVAYIESRLQMISPAVAILKVKADEGEEPPIQLKNSRFLTPFESVTTLYGLPLPSDVDPTPSLAPFFALYFALCLTDGGYGLALALIFGVFLLKTRKSVYEAQLPWLLFISGIASILVGIPFGGWFGLTADQVPAFLTKPAPDGHGLWFIGQLWNLSTQSGINFLRNLSLFLGITHIFFGVFIAGQHKWVHDAKAEAFWQHFTLHILLGSVLFLVFAPEGMAGVAKLVLYACLALVIWGKGYGSPWFLRPIMGVLGFVNFCIGLLSNGLSYLRILALGLVTGAIALAVNQVAIEMGKLFPLWLGIPVTILIAIGGHTVSIALNSLGSFIHSGRLQFIEFFGQFFEGGGRPYTPFKRSIS